MSEKVLVYGDIGGWFDPFLKSLNKYGVEYEDGIFNVPDGLTVIQVGDLVDRGPDSDKLVQVVDKTIDHTDNWIQLLGNHEANHYDKAAKFGGYDHYTTKESQEIIRTWFHKQPSIAVSVFVQDEVLPYLITHSGVHPAWYEYFHRRLDEPDKNTDAFTRYINNLSEVDAFAPGWMMSCEGIPGPIWAVAFREIVCPWIDYMENNLELPFHQVHGHSSVFNFYRNQQDPYFKPLSKDIKKQENFKNITELKWSEGPIYRSEKITLKNYKGNKYYIYGIDQGLGKYEPSFDIEPMVLDNVTSITR